MESRHLAVMMTDIQGFTKATSGMGREDVDALLARHEDLLVPVFEENDGTIVKGLGDAFLVTFESPMKAVRAGMRVQEVLARHNAEAAERERLRVRVAINAGEVNLRGGDVFGEAVNITARVEGVCVAEQVTLTEAVHLLLTKGEFETEYLQEVELKGIPFPVKLYRVMPEWLDAGQRGIERARSAGPTDAGAGAAGQGWGRWALALLVAAGVGFALAPRSTPADAVRQALGEGALERAWQALESARSRSPSPELAAFARDEFLPAALDAAGQDPAARFAARQRFARAYPGVEGLTDPASLDRARVEAAGGLRQAGQFEAAADLLRGAGHPLAAHAATLTAWAQEDLRRLWDEALARAKADGVALSQRLDDPQLARRAADLEALAPDDPFLGFVESLRALLARASTPSSGRSLSSIDGQVRRLGRALAADATLRERQEARPAFEAILRWWKPDEREWEWADPILVHRAGSWLTHDLEQWVNRGPTEGMDEAALIDLVSLRRNAARILAKKGSPVTPEPSTRFRVVAALLATPRDRFGHTERQEELAGLELILAGLEPARRGPLEPILRGLLEPILADAEESVSNRAQATAMAGRMGWDDLVQPDRELFRDLYFKLVSQGGRWNFKFRPYDAGFLEERLAKVSGMTDAGYRGQVAALLDQAREKLAAELPQVLPALDAARQALD